MDKLSFPLFWAEDEVRRQGVVLPLSFSLLPRGEMRIEAFPCMAGAWEMQYWHYDGEFDQNFLRVCEIEMHLVKLHGEPAGAKGSGSTLKQTSLEGLESQGFSKSTKSSIRPLKIFSVTKLPVARSSEVHMEISSQNSDVSSIWCTKFG